MNLTSIIRPGIPSDLRRVHRSLVLRHVFMTPGISRTQLAEDTDLSTMAITRIIRELIEAELIEEVGKQDREGNPGRRSMGLRISPGGAYVVGLVISAFGHEVSIMNAAGDLLISQRLTFRDIQRTEQAVETASNAILAMIDKAGINKERVLGVGIAIAAFVQSLTGSVLRAPYLGWHEVELGREISKRTGLSVIAENIADAINLAEQAKGISGASGDIFLVHASVTIGGSQKQQGDLVRGANFSAGQVGHMRTSESTLICPCGSNDCLNTHASGWSILARLGRVKSQNFGTENIEDYAAALKKLLSEDHPRDTQEGEVLFQAGKHLGSALRNISLIVDPQTLILAGKLSESPLYVAGCRETWAQVLPKQFVKVPNLTVGSVAPVEASGFLALSNFLFSPKFDIDSLLGASIPLKVAGNK